MPLVETKNLSKQFGSITALSRCSLQIPAGQVFGLLGPNGAGKSTLIRLLMGMMSPTDGVATVAGLDCHRESLKVRSQVSYLPGDPRLDRQYRGRDLLKMFTSLRPDGSYRKAKEIAQILSLDTTRRVGSMSTGMRQKLALTLALANDATLIILDEPTSNLDPTIRQQVIELLRSLCQQGRTILFSSHILDEVESVCDQVAILKSGKLATTCTLSDVRQTHRLRGLIKQPLPPPPADISDSIVITYPTDNQVMIEIQGDLQPTFQWLSRSTLAEVTIEPSRLRSLYENILHTDEVS